MISPLIPENVFILIVLLVLTVPVYAIFLEMRNCGMLPWLQPWE